MTFKSKNKIHAIRITPVGQGEMIVLLSIFVLTLTSSAYGIEFKNPDGYAAIELEVEGMDKAIADGTLKLKLETKRQHNLKASADLKLNFNDRDAYIEELKIDYKSDKKNGRWTFGIDKKVIGLEYEKGKRHRLTIRRSPNYQKMEELGIVGRQYSLTYDRKLKRKLRISTGLGADNGRNYNGLLSLQKKEKEWGLGSWYLLESHRINQDQIPVFVQSYALWYRPPQGGIELEIFHGIDARRTEYEQNFGSNRTVHFAGAKFEVSSNHPLGNHFVLTPLFQSSFTIDDLDHGEANTLQFLGGINLTRDRLRVSLNAETYGVKLTEKANERKFNRVNGYVEVVYFF